MNTIATPTYKVGLYDWGDGEYKDTPKTTGQKVAFPAVRIGVFEDENGPTYALVGINDDTVLAEFPLDKWVKLSDARFERLPNSSKTKRLALPLRREVVTE